MTFSMLSHSVFLFPDCSSQISRSDKKNQNSWPQTFVSLQCILCHEGHLKMSLRWPSYFQYFQQCTGKTMARPFAVNYSEAIQLLWLLLMPQAIEYGPGVEYFLFTFFAWCLSSRSSTSEKRELKTCNILQIFWIKISIVGQKTVDDSFK